MIIECGQGCLEIKNLLLDQENEHEDEHEHEHEDEHDDEHGDEHELEHVHSCHEYGKRKVCLMYMGQYLNVQMHLRDHILPLYKSANHFPI